MRVLAIDTAAGACSAAVWHDGVVHQRLVELSRGHAEALLPLLLATMADAGCSFRELDLLAVTIGPGAFTGLRVGLAAARGLALASRLPCVGVTTLAAVAAAVPPAEAAGWPLLVVLDSKRADLYAQLFTAGAAVGEPALISPAGLPGLLSGAQPLAAGPLAAAAVAVAGDGTAMALPALAAAGVPAAAVSSPGYPQAASVAAIAAVAPAGSLPPPVPLYLRPPATGPQQRPAVAGRPE